MVSMTHKGLIIVLLVVMLVVAQYGHVDTLSGYVGNTSTGTVGVSLIIPPKSTGMPVEDADEQFKGIPHETVVEVDEDGTTTVTYIFE